MLKIKNAGKKLFSNKIFVVFMVTFLIAPVCSWADCSADPDCDKGSYVDPNGVISGGGDSNESSFLDWLMDLVYEEQRSEG